MVRGAGFSATAPSGGRGRRCGGGWWLWLGSGVAPPVAQGGDAEGYAAHLSKSDLTISSTESSAATPETETPLVNMVITI